MLVGLAPSTFLALEGGPPVVYVEHPLTLTHQAFGQGNNLNSLSPTHNSVVGYFSHPSTEHKIAYLHLRSIRPITCQFVKAVKLIPGIQNLPYTSRKPKATPTGVVVSLVVEVIIATLEGLAEAIEDKEEPPLFRQGERDTLVILGSNSGTGGGGEGSRGGGGVDEPSDSELE